MEALFAPKGTKHMKTCTKIIEESVDLLIQVDQYENEDDLSQEFFDKVVAEVASEMNLDWIIDAIASNPDFFAFEAKDGTMAEQLRFVFEEFIMNKASSIANSILVQRAEFSHAQNTR